MVKSQADKVFIITNVISANGEKKGYVDLPSDGPPKVPPRMKKKGPALPEKPPHMRAHSNPIPSSQTPREPLKPRILPSTNISKPPGTQREILVAASKAVRERPVEKRQREPAKLLMPTSGSPVRKELSINTPKMPPVLDDRLVIPTKKLEPIRQEVIKNSSSRKPRLPQPIILIPRSMLPWGSTPVSYALWMQRDAAPSKGVHRKEPVKQPSQPELFLTRGRSGSVTRSGSLTSQGSSSSDSGNETFPKSVLKKQKRFSPSTTSKGTSGANRKMEQKKNVTFNAFATVQLMEE
ncbi:uncharacterized protein TNCT_81411 [Trichonephila clavata]|uniref:Uncharacterized protein n=1 Tax=Trichonephila clavata TaxID=2740835 RepID=A0A8X6H7S1_TRICU|nr:uncharacterized protein TNCT_81411 [Trichonephila clavata]